MHLIHQSIPVVFTHLEEKVGEQEADKAEDGDHLDWYALDRLSHSLSGFGKHGLLLVVSAGGLNVALPKSALFERCKLSFSRSES